MSNWIKRNVTHFIVIALFLALCLVYFNPAFLGKSIGQNDVTRAQSTQTEINDYKDKGETILWTNQIHGGMPTFQIWAPYPNNITTWIIKAINYSFPGPVGTVWILLLGTYLLFCVLALQPLQAATGAIAFTFSSYNIILLAAGHANQVSAIAFFAPVIAGIILIFRKKYFSGVALTALFLALEIRANHIQMTFYLFLAILILVGIEYCHTYKSNTTTAFFKSVAYAAAATLLAVSVNASSLWSTYEYGEETIRGRSNLTQHTAKPSNGLSKDYAYQWSQGVGECITFLIPNAYGGNSRGNADTDSRVVGTLTGLGADPGQAAYISHNMAPMYWGEKPFTEGPFYFGAVICFLFTLGLFIVKSRLKWWLVAVIILTMLLSFGKNWPFVSDLFFDYFPLYNKFRAVESILSIGGLCFSVLALLALHEVIVNSNKAESLRKIKISFYITAGISLLFAILPGLFLSFKSSNHSAFIDQLAQMLKIDNLSANAIGNSLIADRKSAAQSDAMRSILFIILSFGFLWGYLKAKISLKSLSIGFLCLVLVDMWSVDKRYLNDESFTLKQDVEKPQPREVDNLIRRDKDPNYRVIDLSQNILSDATTPYFHKSIGGYSAARLKRFDELIENQFTNSINPLILGMMNTRYIIATDPKTQKLTAQLNPSALGHAWFVNDITYVKNPDEEMEALNGLSPSDIAIIDQKYKHVIDESKLNTGPTDGKISLVSYSPDHLIYQSASSKSNLAVFSEIFYDKGWQMLIDGMEKPHFHANYVLRAAQIPAGNHKIEFIFHPNSYYIGEKISLAGSILLILVLLAAFIFKIRKNQPESTRIGP